MAFNAAWWATNWVDVYWDHDFSSASISSVSSGGDTQWTVADCLRIINADVFGDASMQSLDRGRFYGNNAGAIQDIAYVEVAVRLATNPTVANGDLPPPDDLPAVQPEYKTLIAGSARATLVDVEIWDPLGGTSMDLWHYQPDTFFGNPAEITAAILLQYELDDDFIDKTSFSDTDDAFIARSVEPILVVTRTIGQTIADLLKKVVLHTYDLFGVSMNGKISLVSRDDPPIGPTSMTPADVLGDVEWEYSDKHLANYADVGHGQYVWRYGTFTYPAVATAGAALDLNAQRDVQGHTIDTYEDATSQTKYGLRTLSNSQREVIEDGIGRRLPAYRLPFMYDASAKTEAMARLTTTEKNIRRELKVIQDMRGLDYDIGWKVSGIELTGDGDEITDARCIRKKIDFQNLKVTSWLLEE